MSLFYDDFYFYMLTVESQNLNIICVSVSDLLTLTEHITQPGFWLLWCFLNLIAFELTIN